MVSDPAQRPAFDPEVLDQLTQLLPDVVPRLADLIPTWLADQYLAASDQLSGVVMPAWFEAMQASGAVADVGSRPASAAVLARLIYAMSRHVRTWCPDLAIDRPAVAVVLLDRGWMGCTGCAHQAMAMPADDDPRCRLCDTVVNQYWPAHFGFAGVILVADICTSCKSELIDRRPQTGAA
jgi:hypothetical protein